MTQTPFVLVFTWVAVYAWQKGDQAFPSTLCFAIYAWVLLIIHARRYGFARLGWHAAGAILIVLAALLAPWYAWHWNKSWTHEEREVVGKWTVLWRERILGAWHTMISGSEYDPKY